MSDKIALAMIEEHQCPGCFNGHSPESCRAYEPVHNEGSFRCKNWHPSTFMGRVGRIALGLPKGFCRTGIADFAGKEPPVYMRLYTSADKKNSYDKFNVAVWAMEKNGYLYVRCYCPRVNWTFVDVIKGGKLDLAPGAINVGEFINEID